MEPIEFYALWSQAIAFLLTLAGVVGVLYGALRGQPLTVEIEAIPERALVGRHRAPREWPEWLLSGWRALAAAGVPAWTC